METDMEKDKIPEQLKDWEWIEKIGTGAYSSVYKVRNKKNGLFSAMKEIRIPENDPDADVLLQSKGKKEYIRQYYYEIVEDFMSEINLLIRVKDNPNIVDFEEAIVKEREDGIGYIIYIRMEYLYSFADKVAGKGLPEQEAAQVGIQICNALIGCEKEGILHRDIKPDNILCDKNGNYKLADFGVSKSLEKTKYSQSVRGTFAYMAPEVFRGEKYGHTVDIYSLGLVLYRLVNKDCEPFVDDKSSSLSYEDRENALHRRLRGEIIPPPTDASVDFTEILQKCYAFKSTERYQSAAEMKKDLESFLKGKYKNKRKKEQKKKILRVSGGLISFSLLFCVLWNMSEDMILKRYKSIRHQNSSVGFKEQKNDAKDITSPGFISRIDKIEGVKGTNYSNEEVIAAAKQIIGANEGGKVLEKYETESWFVVTHYNNTFLVSAMSSTKITGGSEAQALRVIITPGENGVWEEASPEQSEEMTQYLIRSGYLPKGFSEADQADRNDKMFFDEDFTYLSSSIVYRQDYQCVPKFIWQNEDGTVGLMLQIKNDKDVSVLPDDIVIKIIDGEEIIINTVVEIEMVPAHQNLFIYQEVSAENVFTGTRKWNDLKYVDDRGNTYD